MTAGPWPPAVLRFLADIGDAAHAAFDRVGKDTADFQLGITATSYGDHVATLYEEGWQFTPPTDTQKKD